MKISRGKLSIAAVILLTSILLLSSNVLAAEYPPYLSFVGDFNYNDGQGGSPSSRYLLTFSNSIDSVTLASLDVTQAYYIDNTSTNDPAIDPIIDAFIYFGNLYNDDPIETQPPFESDNLIFGPNQPSGGNTGPVTFEIRDLGVDGIENTADDISYLTATLDYFEVTTDGPVTELNLNYDLNNIYNIQFNDSAPFSRYIDELKTESNDGALPANIYIDFAFNIGSNDFTIDSTGSVSGKIAATPEPISSILFVTGGATLAFRRYLKKRNKQKKVN